MNSNQDDFKLLLVLNVQPTIQSTMDIIKQIDSKPQCNIIRDLIATRMGRHVYAKALKGTCNNYDLHIANHTLCHYRLWIKDKLYSSLPWYKKFQYNWNVVIADYLNSNYNFLAQRFR